MSLGAFIVRFRQTKNLNSLNLITGTSDFGENSWT